MYIASSSTSVKLHTFPDGKLVHNYQPGFKVDGLIRDISWSKDGGWLSLVPKTGQAEIFSTRSLKVIHTIMDVEEPSCTAFQNTTKKFIAFGTRNGQVLVYDIKSKGIRNRYPRASSSITHVEFTAKDTHLVAGCLNGDVLLYSNLTHSLSATYKIPGSATISALRTNPSKRNFIIGGSDEGIIVVWDTNINKHKFLIESHSAPVTGIAFSPINSDLIISTGADRQFCCYDIVSKQRIANVPVNNNMTAVDFSHDGTHFIMASQEGNIYIYDSRRILEPVLVYDAHRGKINNIAFQKREIINSDSSLSEKNMISNNIIREEEEETTNESFGAFFQARMDAGDVPDFDHPSLAPNKSDSFLVALGIGNGHTVGSIKCENNLSTLSKNYGEGDYKETENHSINHLPDSSLSHVPDKESTHHVPQIGQKQGSTSTPNFPLPRISKLETDVSPIQNIANEFKGSIESELVSIDQLKEVTEEIVKKEMSEMISTLTYEMKYQFSSSCAQMRRIYLDMQVSIIKEFIKMENSMNAMREDIASNSPMSENYLLEENLRLKNQIALLQEKLNEKL